MKKTFAMILSFVLILAISFPVAAISSIAVKSIKLNSSKITLKVGQTSNLKVTFTPASTSQKKLTYVTGDKKIATVDSVGKITGVNAGTTTITVYTPNKMIYAKCNVTISKLIVAQITLTTWDGGEEGEWKTFYENLYAAFMKKYPNIKIKQVNTSKEGPDGGNMNLQAALAAGTGPALMNWIPTVQYAKQGYIVPLDNYMKNWTDAKDLNQDIMKFMKFQGKTYCLPSMFSYATPNCIYYRKDNAVKAGIDITKEPKNWAEFEVWMKKFSDNGFKSLMDTGYCFNFQEANGGRRDEKDAEGSVKFVMNSPQNIETYQFVQGLFKKGYVDITEPKSSQSYLDKFITGKAGFMIENFGQLGRSLLPAGLTEEEVGIIGFPAKNGPAKATSMGTGNTAINGTLSKVKQDAAWELMKFVVGSKETFRKIIWPHQKKVDYRPIMLTTFVDMQEEYFKALDVDPKYSAKIRELSSNMLTNNNIPYNDLWQVVTGTDEEIYLKNSDPKVTLDKLAEKITKEVMDPENLKVKEAKFYNALKEKEKK